MTDLEWTQYGDASASHQTTTINGVDYRDLGNDAVNDGVECSEQDETTQGKD